MKSFVSLLSLLSALSLYAFDFTPYRTIVCFGDSITHGGFYPMYLQQYHAETGMPLRHSTPSAIPPNMQKALKYSG